MFELVDQIFSWECASIDAQREGDGAGFAHLAIACPLALAKQQGAKSSQSGFKHSKKRSDISGSSLALNITEIRGDRGRATSEISPQNTRRLLYMHTSGRMHVHGGPWLLVV